MTMMMVRVNAWCNFNLCLVMLESNHFPLAPLLLTQLKAECVLYKGLLGPVVAK